MRRKAGQNAGRAALVRTGGRGGDGSLRMGDLPYFFIDERIHSQVEVFAVPNQRDLAFCLKTLKGVREQVPIGKNGTLR